MKLDATPQGKSIYEKLDFVSEYEIERWTLKRPPARVNWEGLSPELHEVLQVDREVFGADRSALLRSLSESAPDFVQVLRPHTGVTGYTFGRRGSLADELGPWIAYEERSEERRVGKECRCWGAQDQLKKKNGGDRVAKHEYI